jgi:hypothetical protein
VGNSGNDAWDAVRTAGGYATLAPSGTPSTNYNGLPSQNSITEVEMAIRSAQLSQRKIFTDAGLSPVGQIFTSFYFDASGTQSTRDIPLPLHSYYLGFFPTKYFHSELPRPVCGAANYLRTRVIDMLQRAKPITVEVWNTDEVSCTCSTGGISPSPVTSSACSLVLGYELNLWDIDWMKRSFTDGNCPGYKNGRTVVTLGTSVTRPGENVSLADGYPGLIYNFEMSSTGNTLTNWRSMHKR